ncbi:TPA: P-loop ATPase [Pseudomonas aeruginosa]|nr:P-loop ATPase [Pseudomonas aeruginosa]
MESSMAWSGDLLKRKEIAELLTEYLDSSSSIKVVNINSPWGTGKSYFLGEWRLSLFASRPVVYFNAWENDFTGDPLISIVANIKEQLSQYRKSSAIKKSLAKMVKQASRAFLAIAPVVGKGVLKKTTGVVAEELGASVENIAVETSGETAEKLIEKLIEDNQKSLEEVVKFKESLRRLFAEVAEKDSCPVYIFIDELDRCRPTYAIELLERIKHLFEVDGCRFIIATDTVQLSHSIRAVYGAEFASIDYLKRFFDLTYTFEKPDLDNWILTNVGRFDVVRLGYYLSARVDHPPIGNARKVSPINCVFRSDMSENQMLFMLLAKTFDIDLRQLDRINRALEALISRTRLQQLEFAFIAYLCFLMNKDEQLFIALRSDWKGTFELIKKRYPAEENLYFFSSYLNVHGIAYNYLLVAFSNREELRAMMRPDALEFVNRIVQRELNTLGEGLKTYFEEVKLAGRIT